MRFPPSLSLAMLALLCSSGALAADDYTPLLKAKKFADAERAASSRLAKEPANADALYARSKAILELNDGRTEDAVRGGEACVAAQPADSRCHLALGNALGVKAMHGGILSAMGYIGKIRGALIKAVELNPANLEARFSLLQFYLQAPGMVGGGKDKALALVGQTASISPDAARLMTAIMERNSGNPAKAEAAALAVRVAPLDDLAEEQLGLLYSLGAGYVKDKKMADAERIFKTMQQRFPDSEQTLFGGARLLQEQGKHREAIGALEQTLLKWPKPHLHYRIGQSWQALGEKGKAASAYEKALSFKTGLNQDQRADAEVQVKSLKG